MSTTSIGDYPYWTVPTITSPLTGTIFSVPSISSTPLPVEYNKVTIDYSYIIEPLMARLAEFYGLPKEAQSLIMALLKEPKDKDLLSVFADWLEENNRKESTKIRDSI